MNPVLTALLIPFLGTALGAAFVFFIKRDMPELLQKALLGFASGVMVAASVWSLIIPAIEMGEGSLAVIPPVIGLLAGFAFLLLIDYITPHIHINGEAEGPKSRLSRTAKLTLAVTIHNFPEGMAVGVAIAGALAADFNIAGALALSLGIAIQNVPEGAIISMPLRAEGNSRLKSFCIGALSGIVEPIGGRHRSASGNVNSRHNALYAGICRRSNALCRGRRIDSRILSWQALQHRHHRFRTRFRANDGSGCRIGVIFNCNFQRVPDFADWKNLGIMICVQTPHQPAG